MEVNRGLILQLAHRKGILYNSICQSSRSRKSKVVSKAASRQLYRGLSSYQETDEKPDNPALSSMLESELRADG